MTLAVLLSSMPLIFSSGLIWPESAIPVPIIHLVQVVPAVPAIKAFVRLNQMGAGLFAVLPLWGQIWLHGLIYSLIAWLLLRREKEAPCSDRANDK